MLERYFNLSKRMDEMVEAGMNSCNPTVRSIGRKLYKMYQSATKEEKLTIDAYENIYFR